MFCIYDHCTTITTLHHSVTRHNGGLIKANQNISKIRLIIFQGKLKIGHFFGPLELPHTLISCGPCLFVPLVATTIPAT